MDMTGHLLRLLLLLPLICALIVGGLWLAKRVMGATPHMRGQRCARLTETLFLGPGTKLAVVDFADRRLLLAVSKAGVTMLGDAAQPPALAEIKEAGRVL